MTSTLLERLGVEVGAQVRLTEPRHSMTLTGVVDQVGSPGREPSSPGRARCYGDDRRQRRARRLARRRRCRHLGRRAVHSTSADFSCCPATCCSTRRPQRRALLQRDRHDVVGERALPRHPSSGRRRGLAGLEVRLLAGAAFAVGARRQARSLGLLAAAGGSPPPRPPGRARAAAWCSAPPARSSASLLGLVLAAVARPVLTDVADADFGRFDVRPLELLGDRARRGRHRRARRRAAARGPPPGRTRSSRSPGDADRSVRRARCPSSACVLVVVGVGSRRPWAARWRSRSQHRAQPAQRRQHGAGRRAHRRRRGAGPDRPHRHQPGDHRAGRPVVGRLPLAGRLALRDAARHRGRSAPAMAAVLTAVTGSTALVLYVASLDAHDREAYTPSWPSMTGGGMSSSHLRLQPRDAVRRP